MSVYAFSDLHGQYALWEQIKNFIKPEDKVYCLGDCGDRGPHGWQIIKEVLDHPQITYLRGNHDQFIIDNDYWLWSYNGGTPTIIDSQEDTDENYCKVKALVEKTPLVLNYKNKDGKEIALCHSGFDPYFIQFKDELDGFVWDRIHIGTKWPEGWDNLIIIHGHTPIKYMNRYIPGNESPQHLEKGAYWYCGGHKCCIDQGSFITGHALLLDLDTFEEHIFTAEVEKWEDNAYE